MTPAAKVMLQQAAVDLGLHLDATMVAQFALYADELKKWNKKINLTAIKTDEEIVLKHFLDSLALAGVVKNSTLLLDIGSGAGFPCIPLKIALRELKIISIDAIEKKIFFQRHIARMLQLTDFEAVHGRAEAVAAARTNIADVVVSRAFSDLATFAAMGLPFLKPEGILIAMKGRAGREEACAAKEALDQKALAVSDIHEFKLPVCGDSRSLIMIARKSR